MPELLIVTSRWPYGEVPEFLDREIQHLANAFACVRVAPMRRPGYLNTELPSNVLVDDSLAISLAPNRSRISSRSRKITAVRNTLRRGHRRGMDGGFALRDVAHMSWVLQALLRRADSEAVYRWARAQPRPSIAYTFWLGAATEGLRAAWATTPLISRAHGGDVYGYQHGWGSIPGQSAQIAAADQVACVSSDAESYLRSRFPSQANKIVVRKLGVPDLGGLAPHAPGPPIRVISVSSIDENKRVDLIASSITRLVQMGYPVEWNHFGDGPSRENLEAQIAGKPDGMSVRLHGQVSHSEIREELISGGHHVFVNLSKSEGVPVSIIEAQCAGLPVVATDAGGSSEAAPHHLNEFVPVGTSPQGAAEAVLRVLAHNPSEARYRRAHWAENFDSESVYPAFANELLIMARDGRASRS